MADVMFSGSVPEPAWGWQQQMIDQRRLTPGDGVLDVILDVMSETRCSRSDRYRCAVP